MEFSAAWVMQYASQKVKKYSFIFESILNKRPIIKMATFGRTGGMSQLYVITSIPLEVVAN